MKNMTKRKTVKLTASVLILLVLFCVWAPSARAESICRKAMTKCFVDAAITLILAGPHSAAIYATGCINGYIWCLTYYVDF
jgi:hypothetical protein